ncbi:MAG TPA: thiol peroxidase [Sandaracinaceae bacterium LLY-WYZ-13_1]|nr:thiol peroxidase [Sandaracinaceae bacterium LLY-WYZ-13_1]
MAETALKGTPIRTSGELPKEGTQAPPFRLVRQDLSEASSEDYGKKMVLNIFPSIDTSVCATSVRTFNEKAGSRDDAVVLNVSMDLPFAAQRFCGAEGLEGVETLSAFRSTFPTDYGVRLEEGPMSGLTARAVVVLDGEGTVLHRELVPEIAQEPDYDAALAALG